MNKLLYVPLVCLLLSSCYMGRFVVYNFGDLKDYKKFPATTIENENGDFFSFTNSTKPLKIKYQPKVGHKTHSFEKTLDKTGTVAFLVIRNDSLLYENYLHKYADSSIVPAFSMAKAYISALVGIAIDEGHIKSVKDTITQYLPDLPSDPFGKITLEDLLDMRSGLRYIESYVSPFGHVVKSYYGLHLKKMTRKIKAKEAPGQTFEYISVNTQLLGWVLEEATGQSVSEYLEAKIWTPLEMEFPASWSVDSKKNMTEKMFCCLNARARDYAKFGRLYLNKGDWNGEQIISENWVDQSTDFEPVSHYSYQWLGSPDQFYAKGILGQYIFVYPQKNIVIVRLGKRMGKVYWPKIFKELVKEL